MVERPTATARRSPLLDVDPDLGQLLSEDRRAAAHARLWVEVRILDSGEWDVQRLAVTSPLELGLLVCEGVLAREVIVGRAVSTELLGPGDFVRPWAIPDGSGLLEIAVRWIALTQTRIALLDSKIGAGLAQWPEVNAVLIDRLHGRAQRLATTRAISQLPGVGRQLLALLWHLAERWGRVTPDGVVLPLTLSHRMLGELVGARRPTVSVAIAELVRREQVLRRHDGTWLLTGGAIGSLTDEVAPFVPIRRRLMSATAATEA